MIFVPPCDNYGISAGKRDEQALADLSAMLRAETPLVRWKVCACAPYQRRLETCSAGGRRCQACGGKVVR